MPMHLSMNRMNHSCFCTPSSHPKPGIHLPTPEGWKVSWPSNIPNSTFDREGLLGSLRDLRVNIQQQQIMAVKLWLSDCCYDNWAAKTVKVTKITL